LSKLQVIHTDRPAPSLWGRLTTAMRSYMSGPLNAKSPELARLWANPPVSSGVSVNEDTALNYSAVWAAVSLISSQVASLPLILYRRLEDGGKERLTGHPTYRLLHDQPNPEMSSMVFRETLQAHVLTWGNAYAEIEWRGDGRPSALWPLAPNRVIPERQAGRLQYRVNNTGGKDVTIPAEDMLHVPGLGFDGTVGYSPVRMARESIGLGMATERYGGGFFGSGASPGGILTHPGRLTESQQKHLRASTNAQHRGVYRAHNLMILEEGMTYTQIGVDPDSAQFLETRKFQTEEICRWFNLPPHKLRNLDRATFSNIEQQSIEFVTDTLRPWLVRWEQEVNRKIVLQDRSQFVEHLVDGLLRGDIASRYAAYAVGRQWGWLSADDVRERENLNPLPEKAGQMYLVPMNMAPANRINEIVDKQVAPDPKPEPPQMPKQTEKEPAKDDDMPARMLETVKAELRDAHAKEAEIRTQLLDKALAEVADRTRMAAADARVVELTEQIARLQQDATVTAAGAAAREQAIRDMTAARDAAQAAADAVTRQHLAAVQTLTETDAARRQALADIARLTEERAAVQTALEAAEAATVLEHESYAAAVAQRSEAEMALAAHMTAAELDSVRLDAERTGRETAERMAVAERQAAADAETKRAAEAEARAAADAKLAYEQQMKADAEAALLEERGKRAEAEVALAAQIAAATGLAQTAEQRAVEVTEARQVAEREAVVSFEARQLAAEALAKADAAVAERAAFEQAAVAADQARAAAEAKALESEQQRAAAADALESQREAERTRLAGLVAAHRAIVVEAMGRMARREADKARSHRATPEKLRRWAQSFDVLQEPICTEALGPTVRAHVALTGSTAAPEVVTATLVRAHLEEWNRQIAAVLEVHPDEYQVTLERVLTRWETDHAERVADQLLAEAVSHVR
jgi:HK97 family phage portal protein